jgi:hypothetical protein
VWWGRNLAADSSASCENRRRLRRLTAPGRHTTIKTRIVAGQQQVVRVDRETRSDLDIRSSRRLLAALKPRLTGADAVIVGDYGKGLITQSLLDDLKVLCHEQGLWLSLDPKPVHHLHLGGLSLITPNRKETFEPPASPTIPGAATLAIAGLEFSSAARAASQRPAPALLPITLASKACCSAAAVKSPSTFRPSPRKSSM